MDSVSNIKNFLFKHGDSLMGSIVGMMMVHMFTKYSGVGISPDSVMYLSTARNLNHGLGYVYFGDKPIVAFPVFYPTFLAIAEFITHTDPVKLGPYLNELLFGALILLSGVIMERFIFPSKWYKWIILLAIALSPSLLGIYSFLWSETLFILWTLVFILLYHRYAQTHLIKPLVILSIITAIALVTRYAAITLVGTGGLLLLFDANLKPKKKITHIFVFGLISVSLLITNLVRNALVTHTGTGPRYKSLTSLFDNMRYFGVVMCDWFTLNQKLYGLSFIITLILMLAFITIFCYHAFIERAMYMSYENIIVAFFIVYALFMIISATISRYEQINNRLLSPLFIPFLWGCTYWVVGAISAGPAKYRLAFTIVAVAIGLFFIDGELYRNDDKGDMQRYDVEMDYGVPGYTDDGWNKSSMINLMKTHLEIFKPGYKVYNNACEAYYFFTDKSSEYIPHVDSLNEIKRFYATPRFFVVYFDQLPDPPLLTLKQIREHKHLVQIFHSADGGIYECDGP